MLAVWQELRVPVAHVWSDDLGRGHGLSASGWHAKQWFGGGSSKENRARGVPGAATGIQRRIRQVLHETAGHVDPLQLPTGEERHRLVVGRPEGESTAFRPRERPRGFRVQRPEPELTLSVDGRLKHERASVW